MDDEPEYDSNGRAKNMIAHKLITLRGMLKSLQQHIDHKCGYDVHHECSNCGCEFAILQPGEVQPECTWQCPRCGHNPEVEETS